MMTLHVYDPTELTPRDWQELRKLDFSTDDVSCVVFLTKMVDGDGERWNGGWPINPAWRCVTRGHWFVYYHA